MKKHTVEFELYFPAGRLCGYDSDQHRMFLCIWGLRQFLQLPRKLPNKLYVTLSSRKFKNSFPMKLIQNTNDKEILLWAMVDEKEILTGIDQDIYLRKQLGSFKNNPTIHILFESI